MGLHRTYVSSIERGQRNVTLATADRIARALKAIEGFLTGHFDEIEIDGDEELERRETALASAGLSYLDDGLPSEVDESNGEVASGGREVILDTEFIASYW